MRCASSVLLLLSLLVVVCSQSDHDAPPAIARDATTAEGAVANAAAPQGAAPLPVKGRLLEEEDGKVRGKGKGRQHARGKAKRGKKARAKGKGKRNAKEAKAAAKAAKAARAEAKKQSELAHEAAVDARRIACPGRASGPLSKVLQTTYTPIPPGESSDALQTRYWEYYIHTPTTRARHPASRPLANAGMSPPPPQPSPCYHPAPTPPTRNSDRDLLDPRRPWVHLGLYP